MSNNSLINLVEDQMVLLNHCYPDVYTQIQGQATQEKAKPRRRKSKGESSNTGFKKRKLSDEQVNMLEFHFQTDHKLDSKRKDTLASQLELHPRQVAVWFQNRRARWKSKKLEEEYLRLKTQHECTVSEKCLLKSQVLKLKEQLSEKEKEKQKLLEKISRASSNIPSSSISAGVTEPPFLGEFPMEGLESMFCLTENNYEAQGIDYWPNLYDM